MRILTTGDQAPDVEILTAEGTAVRTSQLWADGPVVLAFLRHFG